MPGRAVWDTIGQFLSSPFGGFHAERDYLARVVVPELEDRLRQAKLRVHLTLVDLRLGIETAPQAEQEAIQLEVLSVCLQEVAHCRPFFILLLGDRYGTVMPQERLNAAARRVGLLQPVDRLSVTGLEAEYGIFHALQAAEDEKPRVWVYIRDPLPYERMSDDIRKQYVETDIGNAQRLQELKDRLHQALPERVRHYQASWNDARQVVIGLEHFGQSIVEDLWLDLEEETRESVAKKEPSWEEEEQFEVERFVARRSRVFVGREAISQELSDWAGGPRAVPHDWAQCITGPPGIGKSSLFAYLHLELAKRNDLLVLSHVAGISVRSAQVEFMLRRWIGELAASLGEFDPTVDEATGVSTDAEQTTQKLQQSFASWLGRASDARRVVVLIDALNQFEPTPTASHLTWLPRSWPENARLIATAIPGLASQALSQRSGVRMQELPPLKPDDARDIAAAICRQGHRGIAPEIVDQLLDKRMPNGVFAAGHPLWLKLAVEELNALDEEDFERATGEFAGMPGGDRLRHLRLRLAEELPPTVPELYGWLLKRSEQVVGGIWTRAFVNLLAVSRAGLRESDLRAILPIATGQAWDELRFAVLRRSLQNHLEKQGARGEWSFFHGQLRAAVIQRHLADPAAVQAVHRQIADHLQSLQADDPVRQTELMAHLIGTGDQTRAARYYAELEVTLRGAPTREDFFVVRNERAAATRALASYALRPGDTSMSDGLAWVVSLLNLEKLSDDEVARLCRNYQFELAATLANEATLSVQRYLLEAICVTVRRLACCDPTNAQSRRDASVSHTKLGDVLAAEGNLSGAQREFEEALAIRQSLVHDEPDNLQWLRDLSVVQLKLADLWVSLGNLEKAIAYCREDFSIAVRLADLEPLSATRQRDLSISHLKLGDLLRTDGDLAAAEAHYRDCVAIREGLVASDPDSRLWQRDLAVGQSKLGDVLRSEGKLSEALAAYRDALATSERLLAADPANRAWQRDVSVGHERVGNVLLRREDLAGALSAYQACLSIRQRLVSTDACHTEWQRDLALAHNKVGDTLSALGDSDAALAEYRQSLAARERLASADPRNAQWQRDLSVSLNKVGDVYLAQGHTREGLSHHQRALAIRQRLEAADPKNTERRYDVGIGHERVGDAMLTLGDIEEAEVEFHRRHEIITDLVALDPRNATWQRDLGVSCSRLAEVRALQDDIVSALELFQRALTIRAQLITANPHYGQWRQEFCASCHRLAEVSARLSRAGEDQAWLSTAFEGLDQLNQLGYLTSGDVELLKLIAGKIGRYCEDGSADGSLGS